MTREVMQQALEALEELHRTGDTQVFDMCYAPKVIPALRRELEKPADEPVANDHPLMVFAKECVLGAYSDDEIADAAQLAINAAHGIKEKNT